MQSADLDTKINHHITVSLNLHHEISVTIITSIDTPVRAEHLCDGVVMSDWAFAAHSECNDLGAVSIRKTVLLGMAIPMSKIRRPTGRLIFNMGIPIPGKTVFYIETGPT